MWTGLVGLAGADVDAGALDVAVVTCPLGWVLVTVLVGEFSRTSAEPFRNTGELPGRFSLEGPDNHQNDDQRRGNSRNLVEWG